MTAVLDAVNLMRVVHRVEEYGHMKSIEKRNPGAQVAYEMGAKVAVQLKEWDKGRMILRCDPDFAQALLDTDRDIVVPRTGFEHFPFQTTIVSFNPFDLFDGEDMCRYLGVMLCGATTGELPLELRAKLPPWQNPEQAGWTTYGPVAEHEMLRFTWFFTYPNGVPGGQTITYPWRGDMAYDKTVAEMIEMISAPNVGLPGFSSPGEEFSTLVPLSVGLALYLGSSEPDIDRPISFGGDGGRLMTGAQVRNLGFRVGSALRKFHDPVSSRASVDGLGSGRKLPPHIRSAHWHRFRVATRDESGLVIGDRSGEEGTDWHYILHWIAPTPVNVGDEGPDPSLRRLE